jgi:hypothetical protein
MTRLQFSIAPEEFSAARRRPYEDRLRRIAGQELPAAEAAPRRSGLLLKTIGFLTVVAGVAVSLAIWRIYHFPH